MKDMASSLLAKTTGIFLLVILSISTLLSGIGIYFADENGLYEGVNSYYNTYSCRRITESYAYKVADRYNYEDRTFDDFLGTYSEFNTNFSYKITDRENPEHVLAQNFEPRSTGYYGEYEYDEYIIKAYVENPITARDDYYMPYRLFEFVYPLKYIVVLVFTVGAILIVFDLIFLFCAAGHKRGREGITLNAQDRIPLDLYLAGAATAFILIGFVAVEPIRHFSMTSASIVFLLLLAEGFILLGTLMTLAARLKAGRWWKNTIIYNLLRVIWKFVKKIKIFVSAVIHAVPMVWRAGAAGIAVLAIDTLLGKTLPGFIFRLVILFFLLRTAAGLKRLKIAGERLASGNIDNKINLGNLHGELRRHGENLNSIGEGMAIAVEQKMKSERFKTELITNVSHDIKTPLTSIINYVDLLKKEHSPEQEAEYLEVLDRQSRRLKKLTEDIVEASKASTGNISVNLDKTNIAEIVLQSVGEYEDRIINGSLDIVTSLPEDELYVLADGRLLWRVLDNLMNNVCKYSQQGTRVYIEAKKIKGEAVITIKNISRDKLNIDIEELMDRFVRGDSARNSEGSGLGLNIAKSLVELQKGSFGISVDGDLFKVEIRFKSIS